MKMRFENQRHGRSRKRRDISMRRAISAMVFAICAFWSCPLWAVTVSTEAQLRAAPNVHARVLAVLAEGVENEMELTVCKFACNSDPLRGAFRVQYRPL